jgi:hypothetical protein
MFVNSQMAGLDVAFPDVCLTPSGPAVVPVPYPDIAAGNMAVPAVYNVLIVGAPTHNLSSVVPMTNGDNPGLATGVASGTVMGPSRHVMGSTNLLIGGMPATKMTSPTLQNSTNAPGARLVPSQTKVLSMR